MVRTGARAARLAELLSGAGLRTVPVTTPAARLKVLPSQLGADLRHMYRALGGQQADPVMRPGGWDLELATGVVVELDEELHFNRYRRATLDAEWAAKLAWRDAYLDQCERHERDCVSAGSWGKRWTNPSCEAMFGVAGPATDLTSSGAPRWKQRALYDSVKDACHVASVVRLARLSVHDLIGGVRLGDVLEGLGRCDIAALAELTEARAS
jgi:hypothetical protein